MTHKPPNLYDAMVTVTVYANVSIYAMLGCLGNSFIAHNLSIVICVCMCACTVCVISEMCN